MTKDTPVISLSDQLAGDLELHKTLLEHMIDVITIIDDRGLIAYQSRSIESALGYQPEPMIGAQVLGYIHPDDAHIVQTALERLFTGELDTNEAEFRFRHKDGGYRRMHSVARVWAQGSGRGVLVNSRDITDAHHAKEELAKQNELLTKTYSVTRNLLSISMPASGRFLDVNDAWCEAFGLRREQVIGKTALELGVWGSIENRNRAMRKFEHDGELHNFESSVFTHDGRERTVEINAQLLLVGDQPQVLMACTDITEKRAIEEQLRQSQKMEAIGQLTGGVAHDFNNLIGVTMGNAELLMDEVKESPGAFQYAQQIFEAAQRGAKLTQQLLAFARRQNLDPEPVDLAQHLSSAQSILQTSVSENTLIDIDARSDLWLCQVDPNQLQTALLNLTLNAHDAMPNGGSLRFQLSNYAATGQEQSILGYPMLGDIDPGDYVVLAISDSGTGMDPVTRGRAFEPFYSTKEEGRGTGLGLSMVFGFVKQSGGSICLESNQGSGTTIALLLPRAADSDQQRRSEGDASPLPRRRSAPILKTVLVVEDSHPLRSVLVRAIGDMGYRVLEASGASDLESVLREADHVDLLLSDVILKERQRGPEIAQVVQDRFPAAQVLLMTGFSPSDVLESSEYPVLAKPFTLVELSEELHRRLV